MRASLKTYETTGTYVFVKLSKKIDDNYEYQQRLSLTTEKFYKPFKKTPKIRETFPISSQKTDGSSPAKNLKMI